MNANKLSRRTFLQMSALSAAGAALAACAAPVAPGAEGGAAAPAESNQLSWWMWNTFAPEADEVLEAKLNEWAAANNVTLEISRDSDSNQADKVMPALEAGTLPDGLFTGADVALQMMDAGGTASLKDVFAEVGEAHEGWLPRLEEYATRDGDIQFLPYSIDTPMVHFRQDIFEAAGIEVPEGQWTWEQTRDLCMQAQEYTEAQGDKKIGWGFGVVPREHDGWCNDLFTNFGADIWDETGTKIILADESAEQAVRALNFIKEAWDMGLFPEDAASWDFASNNTNYQEEQGILVINAASIYTWAEANKPELAEVTGLAPKPSDLRDTTNASLRYTLVMNKEAGNPTKAVELIHALYGSEIYRPWLEAGFVTNVLNEYNALPMWEGKRAQFNLAANIGVYSGYPAPFDNAAMAELGSGNNAPVGSMVVRVLIDGWTPEEAIAESDEFAKRVFEKYF
jgi:ABC-type glycerol-3-phosphate transport system substrate-binding protein